MKTLPTFLLSAAVSVPQVRAFLLPYSTTVKLPVSVEPLQLARRDHDNDGAIASADESDAPLRRRHFLMQSLGAASFLSTCSVVSLPSITHADDDYLYKRGGEDGGQGDLTNQLFNEDGSLRDTNLVVEAKENKVNLPFSLPSTSDGININIATDGVQSTSSATDATTSLKASYKIPLKWNQEANSQFPLYYDSSEGKNGKSCNRITVYSISAPNNLDMSTLEKASRVGVAKSLFMDQIPNKYFDQGVTKADLISGRTVRKPIKSLEEEGEYDEQIYYEFDLAFAPLECPDFMEGNKENLGLGFCPYDKIFLVSATVLKDNQEDKSGTLMCCVVECDKVEWKMANSDLKRVRSSFAVDRGA